MGLVQGSVFYEDTNFWDLNTQLKLIQPFNMLYARDDSSDKGISSKEMWCIFFMCEPDEDENKFFRIPVDERYEMLKETFFSSFNKSNLIVKECMEQYPILCLTAVQRALKDEKEMLMKRAKFLKEQEYTLDKYDVITGPGGRPVRVTLPGTAKQLDTMHKATKTIMDNFKLIENDFFSEKSQSQLKGNRKESKSEKGDI